MKKTFQSSFLLPVAVALGLMGAAAFWSAESQANVDPQILNNLLLDLAAQQKELTDNQTEIETRIAAVQEEVRMARIFARRGGGGGGGD